MSDETKGILQMLEAMASNDDIAFLPKQASLLLDYITNLQEENDRLNNIREYAIQFININQDEKTFALDYYNLKKLRGILNDNDFYIELFKEQLKELKENNNE